MKAVWISREEARIGEDAHVEIKPDWTFSTMGEFTDAIEAERESE